MSKNLKFYTIDTEYIKYLRNIDNRVADTSIENKKEKRKFIGILLKIDNKNYLAPLSSKKEKFLKMKNSIDFIKINSGLEGAINLNNMIPVYNQFISEYKVEEELDVKYKKLVQNQLSWCNEEINKKKILESALELYELIEKLHENNSDKLNESKKLSGLKERCCNFKLLEEKSLDYHKGIQYNCLTGNRINIELHSSGENKWIAKKDIEKFEIEKKEEAKEITDEDRLQCQCGGCLVVEKITKEYKIKNNNECIIEDIPILQCSNCKKEVPNFSLFVKEVIKSSLQVLEESSIGNKKFNKKFITFFNIFIKHLKLTYHIKPKLPFKYDILDYYVIPGLFREYNIGFLTPVFFDLKVLDRYLDNQEYELELKSGSYYTLWKKEEESFAISFGINGNQRVIMWLGDILELPEKEQYYLLAYNVESDHNLKSEFYNAQILVEWGSESKEGNIFKIISQINKKIKEKYSVNLTTLEKETLFYYSQLHIPIKNTKKEFESLINILNKILVENIDVVSIKKILETKKEINIKSSGSLKLLAKLIYYICNFNTYDEAETFLSPLFCLYNLRIAADHLLSTESEMEKLGKSLTKLNIPEEERENYSYIYQELVSQLEEIFISINQRI